MVPIVSISDGGESSNVSESTVHVKRALLSVADKHGLAEFAQGLHALGIELVSTGGTAAAMRERDLPVTDVSTVTQFPEMMDGRVKTLHPAIHGGLLCDAANPAHLDDLATHGIELIDLVVANFYPFAATLARGGAPAEMIESIDIGGPAMVRAAAKNHARILVVTRPEDYEAVLAALRQHDGCTSAAMRRQCAARAFAMTAQYDAAIATWTAADETDDLPASWSLFGERSSALRYGENPHQRAAAYRSADSRPGVLTAELLQGKQLSFNNLQDADLAFEAAAELFTVPGVGCVIVKHATPCGAAVAAEPADAFRRARAADATSAFGGVVAFNAELDGPALAAMADGFFEVVIAPTVSDEVREQVKAGTLPKNLRLLVTGGVPNAGERGAPRVRSIAGGFLVQDRDAAQVGSVDFKTVTERAPSEAEVAGLLFAWRVVKYVRSNAIVLARGDVTVGIGGGQTSRVDAVQGAVARLVRSADAVRELDVSETAPLVLASDAFFPFPDGLEAAAAAGVTAIVQPGGSVRDDEVIAAADRLGLAMVFTGVRHFLH